MALVGGMCPIMAKLLLLPPRELMWYSKWRAVDTTEQQLVFTHASYVAPEICTAVAGSKHQTATQENRGDVFVDLRGVMADHDEIEGPSSNAQEETSTDGPTAPQAQEQLAQNPPLRLDYFEENAVSDAWQNAMEHVLQRHGVQSAGEQPVDATTTTRRTRKLLVEEVVVPCRYVGLISLSAAVVVCVLLSLVVAKGLTDKEACPTAFPTAAVLVLLVWDVVVVQCVAVGLSVLYHSITDDTVYPAETNADGDLSLARSRGRQKRAARIRELISIAIQHLPVHPTHAQQRIQVQ